MRGYLLASVAVLAVAGARAATAADMPLVVKAPPAVWSWTGGYFGVHVGEGWGWSDWQRADGNFFDPLFFALQPGNAPLKPFPADAEFGGWVGGAQIGGNYQIGPVVLGAELDVSAADLDGNARCANGRFVCNTRIDALATITGRFGYAINDLLLYGKGGAAWAHDKFHMTSPPEFGVAPPAAFFIPNVFDAGQSRWGWTVGGGVEHAFGGPWSGKVEYNYINLGTHTPLFVDQLGNQSDIPIRQALHVVKLGVNYHPDWEGARTPASVAKIPVKAPPLADAWSWTGLYIGGHGGGGFGRKDWSSDPTGFFSGLLPFGGSSDVDGFVAGGQVGGNYQIGRLVLGVEADASWADLDGNAKCAVVPSVGAVTPVSFTCHTRVDALATVTGRVGGTYGNALVYLKGGAAWAHDKYDMISPAGNTPPRTGPTNLFNASEVRAGWTVGAGLEYAFTPNWSGKVEYDYLGLGTRAPTFVDQFGNRVPLGIGEHLHVVKIGLNFRPGGDAFYSAPAAAAPVYKAAVYKASPAAGWSVAAAGWSMDVGARYWYSSGRMQKDLFGGSPSEQLNSRLTFAGLDGPAAEMFARFDHRSGVFVKGNFGVGDILRGVLNDEDFPPIINPYSNTASEIKDSRMRYASLDVGHNFLNWGAGKAGGFVGFRYFYERANGFGCQQATNQPGCNDPAFFAAQPTSLLTLTEAETWRGIAVGLNTEVMLSDRMKLGVDAAYLPYVNFAGIDNHWNRPDINPLVESGHGWGMQFEAVLSYLITERLSVGVGGRYWYLTTTTADTRFPGLVPQLWTFYTQRYGGFLQASYKLGDAVAWAAPSASRSVYKAPPPVFSWTGVYLGAHLGAAWSRTGWSDPFGGIAWGDVVYSGGAIAGGQVGGNYQVGAVVLGVEADGSWARIVGSNTCFPGISGLNCDDKISALATATGRVGYALDRTLLYLKAGGAWARVRYNLNLFGLFGLPVATTRIDQSGWTTGAGIEHALSSNWSIRLEYNYLDFGSRTVPFAAPAPAPAALGSETIGQNVHTINLGVNCRFN
jgi:opacity protein-like surface antigen